MKNILKGVWPAADLVDAQPGAVVSRTLVNEAAGTVTLFAFDEGQSLSEHTAPFDALVVVMEGEAEIDIDGVGHPVAAGDLLIMPAHRRHAVRATRPFKMMLVMIRSMTDPSSREKG